MNKFFPFFFATMVYQKRDVDILLLPHVFIGKVLPLLFDIVQFIQQEKENNKKDWWMGQCGTY